MTPAATKSLALRNRKDFPILNQEVYSKPLVLMDNAATSQKPIAVIKSLTGLLRTGQLKCPSRGCFMLLAPVLY
jgi:selenocysteine lyase/cysteine desulfurase